VEFRPNSSDSPVGVGISAHLDLTGRPGETISFSWEMDVDGGGSVSVLPLGRNSNVFMNGDWPSPSFSGAALPSDRIWDETGFSAEWKIPEVSRPLSAVWTSAGNTSGNLNHLDQHMLMISLKDPADAYARAERSVKYGALFLLIPFVVFFLFESLSSARIHPVQYLLAGAADVLFYLLFLALSEHLSVGFSYLIAAASVTGLVGLYAAYLLKGLAAKLTMPAVMAAAYLWLWVSLQSEDYALLIGAVGLFVLPGTVMILTRKVAWNGSDVSDLPSEGKEG